MYIHVYIHASHASTHPPAIILLCLHPHTQPFSFFNTHTHKRMHTLKHVRLT